MKLIRSAAFLTIIIFASTSLYAEISVIKVQGNAAYREGRSWLPLKEKQKLPEGVKISTGANSYAELSLNSKNHTVTIKPLTMIQVFSKETAENTDTHIGLKRGGLTARVPRDANVKTIFKVSSPIATSSVRGTEEDISYGIDKGMVVKVISGEIMGTNRNGRSNYITGRQAFVQVFNQANTRSILNDVRSQTFVDVYGNGLTPDEIATNLFSGDDGVGGNGDDATDLVDRLTHKTRVTIEGANK